MAMNRRGFVGAATALLAASAAGGGTRKAVRAKTIIDVHAHPVIPLFIDLIHRSDSLSTADAFPYKAFYPPRLPSWTPEAAMEMMDRSGIAAQALSLPEATTALRGEFARSYARRVNEELARIVSGHPRRFTAFAVLPYDDMDSTLAEIAYALDVLNLDGICTTTNIRGVYLGDPALAPWLEELNRRAATLFVHPALARSQNTPAPLYLEFSFDTARMLASMVLSGTKRRLPRINIISTHGGGGMPFLTHRFELLEPLLGRKDVSAESIKADLASFYYDLNTCMDPAALAALARLAGPARLMMGFDFPYVSADLVEPELERFFAFDGFDQEQKSAIASHNALALLPRLASALAQA